MVIKLLLGLLLVLPGFESSVISYGNQTCERHRESRFQFESSVISYGNQTKYKYRLGMVWFESSVISYGNQTSIPFDKRCFSV